MISAKLIASSTPGMAKARSCIIEPIIPFESAVQSEDYIETNEDGYARTLFHHFLDGTCWINLHCKQIFKSVHFGCILRKLLAKGIGEIVGGISGLREE